MKIAVWYNLHSGGGKRALYDQIKGLVENGHTVEVWSPPVTQKEYLPLDGFGKEHTVPFDFPPKHYPGRIASLKQKNRFVPKKLAAMDAHCRQCAKEINAGGFDLLLAHSCYQVATAPIARYVPLPSVLYLQEPYRYLYEAIVSFPWKAPEPSEKPFPKRQFNAFMEMLGTEDFRLQVREEQCSAAAFTRILVNSYFSREAILRAYGLDSHVCYLGVNTELFAYRNLPRESYVIGLGAFLPAKNQELAIMAMAQVPEPRPRLVWVGNITPGSDYFEHLKTLAEQNGVVFEPKVLVSDGELVDLLNRASMMLSLSRLEPFGYAPLEANSCGTPVIAIPEGGMRETIRDGYNGLVTDPAPEALAAAIVRLRDNPQEARQFGETAAGWVREQWSLAAASERVEQQLRLAKQECPVTQPSY